MTAMLLIPVLLLGFSQITLWIFIIRSSRSGENKKARKRERQPLRRSPENSATADHSVLFVSPDLSLFAFLPPSRPIS